MHGAGGVAELGLVRRVPNQNVAKRVTALGPDALSLENPVRGQDIQFMSQFLRVHLEDVLQKFDVDPTSHDGRRLSDPEVGAGRFQSGHQQFAQSHRHLGRTGTDNAVESLGEFFDEERHSVATSGDLGYHGLGQVTGADRSNHAMSIGVRQRFEIDRVHVGDAIQR